jgi:DNA-binding HxlR family transcriptional regulator
MGGGTRTSTRRIATTPKPGRPVRGSRTGQPLNATFDLLGRRWALSVVWALRNGPTAFLEVQSLLEGISSSVLTNRLRELGEAGVVTTDDDGRYLLTPEGRSLCQALHSLRDWSDRWSRRVGGPKGKSGGRR